MKNWKLFTALAALAFAAPAAMADGGDGKIAFGPQGGVVFTNFNGDNNLGATFKENNGWMAGAFLEFGVWSVTLRPEANYVRTGYSAGGVDIKNNYLEIPLLLKFNPLADSVVSPFILVGPSWSKHLSTDVSGAGVNVSRNYDGRNFWSGVAGLGIEFNVAHNVGLNLQGRYNFGFDNVNDQGGTFKSRSIYALAGLSIQN